MGIAILDSVMEKENGQDFYFDITIPNALLLQWDMSELFAV